MWPFPQNNLRFFHLDMLCPRFRSRNAKWFCLKMGCPAVMTNLRAKIIIHRNQPVELGLPFFLGRLISNKLPDLRVLATLVESHDSYILQSCTAGSITEGCLLEFLSVLAGIFLQTSNPVCFAKTPRGSK